MNRQHQLKFLVEKEVDHLKWINALSEVFSENRVFKQQLDPTKCGFGKWYYELIKSIIKLEDSLLMYLNLDKIISTSQLPAA